MSIDMKNNACDPDTRILPFEYFNCHNIENGSMAKIATLAAVMGTAYLAANSMLVSYLYFGGQYAYQSDWKGVAVTLPIAGIAGYWNFLTYEFIDETLDCVHFLADYGIAGSIDKFCDITEICSLSSEIDF